MLAMCHLCERKKAALAALPRGNPRPLPTKLLLVLLASCARYTGDPECIKLSSLGCGRPLTRGRLSLRVTRFSWVGRLQAVPRKRTVEHPHKEEDRVLALGETPPCSIVASYPPILWIFILFAQLARLGTSQARYAVDLQDAVNSLGSVNPSFILGRQRRPPCDSAARCCLGGTVRAG